MNYKNFKKSFFVAIVLIFSPLFFQTALAAPSAEVTLTFDDAWLSQYQYAAPILRDAGQKATLYVPTGLVGTERFMTWQNVVDMVVNDGWEVGGHTVTHSELPLLTEEQIREEIRQSFEILENQGFMPTNFATPFGAYNPTVITQVASYYMSHRTFHGIGFNAWPFNQYLIFVQQINNQTTPAQVEAWIQEAQANNYWLVIVFHEILPTVAPEDTYSWTTENLQALMAILQARGIKTKTVAEVLNMKESLFTNYDFSNGINNGWTTNSPSQVVADINNHGAIPSVKSSIQMTGGTSEAILSSHAAAVSSTAEYGIRIFTNTVNLTSGDLGYYLDEYDSSNEYIDTIFLGPAFLSEVIDNSFYYQPSSSEVASVILNISLSADSVGYAFIDNAKLFEMGEGDPLPIPNPTAQITVPPLPLPNTDFANGIADGWKASNSQQITFDTLGNGNSPTADSSIKMTGIVSPIYLFSPKAQVSFDNSYSVSVYSDTEELTSGELGFYVDEYNSSGVWTSGKWVGLMPLNKKGTLSFIYTPTSNTITSASLQMYLAGGSTGNVFVDNAQINLINIPSNPISLPFPNSDFSNGMSDGWTTNNLGQVAADTNNHGSAPTADSSIKMTNGGLSASLFSLKALINSSNSYNVSVHTNTEELTSGELGVYVDEFDVNKNWISGKWLGLAALESNENLNFLYAPTGANVNSAVVQIYLTDNSEGQAFVDNVEMTLIVPPPPPISLPIPNSDFANGISNGWTTNDSENVLADLTGRGADPNADSSIKMNGSGANSHLFSPKVLIDSTKAYNVLAHVDSQNLTSGELGFYIDEYNANQDWVSGKWLGQATLNTTQNLSLKYEPTGVNVSSVSVQVYLTANSNGEAFLDNIKLEEFVPPVLPTPITLPFLNTDFSNGIANGWTTNNALQVSADSTGKGNTPTVDSTIKMTGDVSAAHLFSEKALVNPAESYNVTGYFNTQELTLGETGIYVDEYDVNQNWISGKWLGQAALGTTQSLTFKYTPTNSIVNSANLQIYLSSNSTGNVYLDNIEMNLIVLPPAPIVLPLPNSDFANGIASGWTTNKPEQVLADSTGKGNAPTVDSTIKMTGGTAAAHLFSPKAVVDATKTYTVSAFANTQSLTAGEAGLFMDEYDVNQNWISGKWLVGAALGQASVISRSYLPTSANVASVSLQVYITANAVGDAFVDNAIIEVVP